MDEKLVKRLEEQARIINDLRPALLPPLDDLPTEEVASSEPQKASFWAHLLDLLFPAAPPDIGLIRAASSRKEEIHFLDQRFGRIDGSVEFSELGATVRLMVLSAKVAADCDVWVIFRVDGGELEGMEVGFPLCPFRTNERFTGTFPGADLGFPLDVACSASLRLQ